ncbi:L-rhamnose mutarotase [Alteromonadaceae bacterium Bs31]|nr:L-rhamnose mutarotase [Alteromonadaceae bacterium Bs31]
MEKIAFTMQLNPGCQEEYKKRHDYIWPQLLLELKGAGIRDYSIFLDEGSWTLFGVLWRVDEHGMNELPEKAIMKKWWAHMADIMVTNPNKSPVVNSLKPVFHMD